MRIKCEYFELQSLFLVVLQIAFITLSIFGYFAPGARPLYQSASRDLTIRYR